MITEKCDILPDILNEPLMVSTLMDESIAIKKGVEKLSYMLPNRVTHVELVELNMRDFDVILGMDWLQACFASIDCRTRVVKFNFPNQPVLEGNGGNYIPRGHIISCLNACSMISKGYLYHIVRVKYLNSKVPPIELVLVVREFV